MKDVMKKVVILENLSSPYVHQAIIVMRDYDPQLESLAVMEAEKIVSSYLDKMETKKRQPCISKAARKKHSFLFTLMSITIAALAVTVFILKH